jgi:hypothetical protein
MRQRRLSRWDATTNSLGLPNTSGRVQSGNHSPTADNLPGYFQLVVGGLPVAESIESVPESPGVLDHCLSFDHLYVIKNEGCFARQLVSIKGILHQEKDVSISRVRLGGDK